MDLQQDINALHSLVLTFKPEADHLVPDLALIAFLDEVQGNAATVLLITNSEAPSRPFPNARATFEAAQQAMLLASDPDYDLAGAKAWVYYRQRDFRLQTDAEVLFPHPDGVTAEEFHRGALEEMADTWEKYSPGKRGLIDEAEKALKLRGRRRPDNWAGVNPAHELDQRLRNLAAFKGLPLSVPDPTSAFRLTYSILSRQTHPRTTGLEPTRIRGEQGGIVAFEFDPDDGPDINEVATQMTAGAVKLAMAALSWRLNPPPAPPKD